MLTNNLINTFVLNDNVLTNQAAIENGFGKNTLNEAYKRGDLEKLAHGKYAMKEIYFDDMYIKQARFPLGIYSHRLALFLTNLTSVTPHYSDMTFPRGYNNKDLPFYNINPYYIKDGLHGLGKIETRSIQGNPVYSYDLERTVLDLLYETEVNTYTIQEIVIEYNDFSDITCRQSLNKMKVYAEKMNRVKEYMRFLCLIQNN